MKAEVRKNYNTDTQTNENVRNYQIVRSTISYTEDPTLRHIPLEEALPRLRAAIHKQESHKMVHLAQLWVLPFYFVLLHTQNTQYLILPSSIFEISEKTLFSKLPFSKGFIRQHKANCFPSFPFCSLCLLAMKQFLRIYTTNRPLSLVLLRTIGHFALLLLLVDLLVVERQLLVLQNVSVSTTALTRTRRDASQDLTRSQLIDHFLLLLKGILQLLQLRKVRLAHALQLAQIVLRHLALRSDLAGVVLLEPRLEGGRIDRNNAALHNGVRTHQLVVGSVVHNVQDLGLGRESYKSLLLTKITLSGPGERTSVQTNGAVLNISTTAADQVNSLGSELGHGRLTTHLELSLLDVDHNLSSGQTTLMARITANT